MLARYVRAQGLTGGEEEIDVLFERIKNQAGSQGEAEDQEHKIIQAASSRFIEIEHAHPVAVVSGCASVSKVKTTAKAKKRRPGRRLARHIFHSPEDGRGEEIDSRAPLKFC